MKLKARKTDEQKFKELILYISQKCACDPKFGATKLNKIMFYSDFLAYANLGKPITGFQYQKLPNGPAPRRLVPVRKQMMNGKELGIQEVPLKNGHVQKRTVNLRPPNLLVFSAEEISLIDRVIEALADSDAETVSELSHREVGWIVAEEGEDIPYSTICLSNAPLTEMEIQRGREIAERYDWQAA